MPERRVVVGSSVGLHARPAALFVQAAAQQSVEVLIGKDGGEFVDARSILSVIGLDAKGGDEVVLRAEGENADIALDELATMVATDHDAQG
ncbi:HPr family phosphocarrier protein [Haloechinothrix halophila]|uniref:HPr family phosphocarrier protein n=1 Tax=Haloechinothrix halophila TaxID=1069073 RepID=UPI0003F4DF6A|nr:HPr family phosphocarrier protein [Haloechinothrix halophila]